MKNALHLARPVAALLGCSLALAGSAQAQEATPAAPATGAAPATTDPAASPAAQPQPGKLYVGLVTGLNLATYTGRAAGLASGPKSGLALGLRVAYPLGTRAGLHLEAAFSQKGLRRDNYGYTYPDPALQGTGVTYRASLAYLDVPLLFTYGPGSAGRAGFYAAAGPQLSLALGQREFVQPTSLPGADNYQATLSTDTYQLSPVSAGAVLGLGYQFANGIGAEVRYSQDMTRTYRDGGVNFLSGLDNRFANSVLQVQLSFRLRAQRGSATTGRSGRSCGCNCPDDLPQVYQNPGLRRFVRVLEVLSWINHNSSPGPVYTPGSLPRPDRSGYPSAPRPASPGRRGNVAY